MGMGRVMGCLRRCGRGWRVYRWAGSFNIHPYYCPGAMRGYTEAAQITHDSEEPAEDIRNDVPSGFRVIDRYHDGKMVIEKDVGAGGRWVEFARFSSEHADWEFAQDFADELNTDDYRVVFDYNANEFYVETWEDDE
jgi:hypothetical protein